MSHHEHKLHAPASIGVAIVTVSDTRTMVDDTSGALAHELLEKAGILVKDYRIVKDGVEPARAALQELAARNDLQAILLSGGTGISLRDRTFEAVERLFDRKLDGFGELFRYLSFGEIGSSAMLSRAVAGLVRDKIVFSLPGSSAAVRLALEKLIIPELGHIIGEIDKQRW